MAGFDSPIGRKNFGGSQQMKEFNVPDESENFVQNEPVVRRRPPTQIDIDAIRDYQSRMQELPSYDRDPAEVEREIRQARADKKAGRERLNDGAKKRIEMLIGMTRNFREVEIEKNKFILKTLKSKEMREALMEASKYDGTIQSPFEIRKQLLARSLTSIAGVDIENFIGSNDIEDKCVFIDELDESLLNRLYEEYLLLVQESKQKFAIKNETDIHEVVEDLKK